MNHVQLVSRVSWWELREGGWGGGERSAVNLDKVEMAFIISLIVDHSL